MPAALQISEQCCADSERVLGPDHPDTLARMAHLAYLYHEVGRIGDAESLLRRTAAYRERSLAHGHPLTQAISQRLPNIEEG